MCIVLGSIDDLFGSVFLLLLLLLLHWLFLVHLWLHGLFVALRQVHID
jgi:hypothetical protein